jgi:hypothetical protein
MNESVSAQIIGHVLVKEKETNAVMLDKFNAVHPKNMALILARALAHEDNSWVDYIALGNGGTHISSSGSIIYLTPNTTGVASLYNQTYSEQVDPQSDTTPSTNGVVSRQLATPKTSSIIEVTVEIDSSEPNGQFSTDDTNTNADSSFTFDELGLFSHDGLLLTHIVFEPITKTANRGIVITYTVEIKVS